MAQTDEYIDEAYETLKRLSADEKKRLEYEAREKALRDYNQQVKSYYDRGRAEGAMEGREEGKEEERALAIRNLEISCKKFGGSREAVQKEIAETYHLSADEAESYMQQYW